MRLYVMPLCGTLKSEYGVVTGGIPPFSKKKLNENFTEYYSYPVCVGEEKL